MRDLIRKTDAFQRFLAARNEEKLSHAYLVIFDDPVHTKTVLQELAKALFFAEENDFGEYDSPQQERIARLIDEGHYTDCLFFPKNEKRLNVEESESIVEECYVRAMEGDKKVVVIDRFDEALPPAQNKLLKVLEEPHEGVFFLLSARTPYPVLQTVLSRVQRLEILPFSIEEVGACLQRNCSEKYNEQEIKLVSALSCGSVGTAEALLISGYYKTLLEDAFSLCLAEENVLPAIVKQAGTTKNKKELITLLRLIFRDAMMVKSGRKSGALLTPELQRITAVAQRYSSGALLYAQERLAAVEKETVFNANFAQCIELCMARILKKG